MSLITKIRQYTGASVLICAAGLTLSGCLSSMPVLDDSQDSGSAEMPIFNSPYEAVAWASTVEEAFAVVKNHIQYANQDVDRDASAVFPERKLDPYASLANLSAQGFRESFQRGAGICKDTAVAMAALLQDDGFPPLTLSIAFNEDRRYGHEVFVYQGKDGRWGSGEGPANNEGAKYESLEELAEKTAKGYGYTLDYYSLNNIRHVDLVEGVESRNGMIPSDIFEVESYEDGKAILLGSMEKTQDGYQRLFIEETDQLSSDVRIDYNPDFQPVYSDNRSERKIFPNDSFPTTRQFIRQNDYNAGTSYLYEHSVYDRESNIIRETIGEQFFQYGLKTYSRDIIILGGTEIERNEITYSYDASNQLVSETSVLTTPEGTTTNVTDNPSDK